MTLAKSTSSAVVMAMVTVRIYIRFRTSVRLSSATNVKFKFTTGQVTVVVIPTFVNLFVLELFQTVVRTVQWFSVTCLNAMTVVPDMSAFQIAQITCVELLQTALCI